VYAQNHKALDMLGWYPRYGAQEIMETAWRWHAGGGGLLGPGPSTDTSAAATTEKTDASSG
jgi:hypothetical protein